VRLGIVTGIRPEHEAIRRAVSPDLLDSQVVVRCSAARAEIARRGVSELAALPVDALLSFGIAGGLRDDIAPGTVVVADRITIGEHDGIGTDRGWRERLVSALRDSPPLVAAIHGSDSAVTDPDHKRRLHRLHGAVAVDMESHHAAMAARAAGIPFLAIRVVGDRASRRVPAYAMAAVGAQGETRVGPVLAGLARRPADLPSLIGLGWETGTALKALRRVASRHGPFFGLV
jgi:hopanoid-associated phosphorylase